MWVDLNVKSPEELDPKKEYRVFEGKILFPVGSLPRLSQSLLDLVKMGCPLQVRESQPQEQPSGISGQLDDAVEAEISLMCGLPDLVIPMVGGGMPDRFAFDGETYEIRKSGTSLPVGEEEGPTAEEVLEWLLDERKRLRGQGLDMGGNHPYLLQVMFRLHDDTPIAAYLRAKYARERASSVPTTAVVPTGEER